VSEDIVKPRVGLITKDDARRHALKKVLNVGGFSVAVSLDVNNLAEDLCNNEADIDAWLLDLTDSDIQAVLNIVVENSTKLFLINDEIPAGDDVQNYDYWQRRLLEKLEVVALPQESEIASEQLCEGQDEKNTAWADKVWVLAASLGGPEAVSRFLKNLPTSLPIAMVYAQHTETNFDSQLVQTISRAQNYPVQLVRGEQMLCHGEIFVVPVDRQLRFLPFGKVVEKQKSWDGIYQPVIDQVIAELARLYRDKLGVIIFSGTCNDGEIGVRVAKACGSTVWAQTPESCVSPDMPQSAIDTGCVSEHGTPEELADLLSEQLLA